MKKILGLVALVATLGLASCQKNEGPQVEQKMKSVTLNLANVFADTKSMQDDVATSAKVKVNDLQIFFVNGNTGALEKGKVAELTSEGGYTDAQHYFDANSTVKITDLSGANAKHTATYHYLPAEVNKVVVVGNLGAEKSFTSYSDILAAANTGQVIADEQDVNDLTLYGETTTLTEIDATETGHTLYKADVNLTPLVSRLEIKGFTYAKNDKATGEGVTPVIPERKYKKIEVAQVVLNNYYQNSTIGTLNNNTLTNLYNNGIGTEAEGITDANVFDFFDKAMVEYNKDANNDTKVDGIWYTDPLSVSLASTTYTAPYADDATRPCYNFFPANEVPQLVVKLYATLEGETEAETDDTVETLYLATSNIYKSGNTSIAGRDVNQVYQMEFTFDDEDLENPVKCIQVNVTVASWVIVPVTPEF